MLFYSTLAWSRSPLQHLIHLALHPSLDTKSKMCQQVCLLRKKKVADLSAYKCQYLSHETSMSYISAASPFPPLGVVLFPLCIYNSLLKSLQQLFTPLPGVATTLPHPLQDCRRHLGPPLVDILLTSPGHPPSSRLSIPRRLTLTRNLISYFIF